MSPEFEMIYSKCAESLQALVQRSKATSVFALPTFEALNYSGSSIEIEEWERERKEERNKAVNEMRNFPFRRRALFAYSKEVDNNHKIEAIRNDFLFILLRLCRYFRSIMTFFHPATCPGRQTQPALTINCGIGIRHHLRGFSMLASSQCKVDQYLLSTIKLYFSERPSVRPSADRRRRRALRLVLMALLSENENVNHQKRILSHVHLYSFGPGAESNCVG